MEQQGKKTQFLSNFIKSLKISQNYGYTLVEVLTVLVILGIMGALVGPRLFFGDSSSASGDAYNLAKSLVGVTRQRAISQTSAARLSFDPNQSDKFLIEIANTRGCEALTRLSEAAVSSQTDIKVYSTTGFQIGDKLKIGSDTTSNEITGKDNTTITLGVALGTSQNKDSTVELVENWKEDSALNLKKNIGNGKYIYEYLQLPENVTVTSNITNWTLCFNSRGIATIYDNSGNSQAKLELTFKDGSSNEETLTILKGGAIATN
ncbi:prepilin-type N-terminal cleavage/methylation domain-containing protein [Cyanobacterium aponinum UTEX 3221]|uniref:pilus assembly FimT family protein n=1 Tax=Cyanobacterium aponinum TaxID=379064 RepID=UPI002B4C151F|nr:prepilin-type N-terminal cleavage/methylation domain-containing protein [Cyanobacterium aponinum]WRL39547.1 prepilin-type N-terminal cleavage/methylation domain-containing protein [Cyanobacterium aponinum UTEX 3221]